MSCFDSTMIVKSHLKRKRHLALSHEQTQHQEEDRDEARYRKITKHHSTWENLDLILTLQSKELHLERKIKDAFDFANLGMSNSDRHLQPVSFSRALRYACDWMQSLLISSDRNRMGSECLDPCLDYRCWAIIRFCLENSSPRASTNLFRAVTPVLKHALLLLDSSSTLDRAESISLFENVLVCLSTLLASNSRAFYNVGVHLWISCVGDVLSVISRISSMEEKESSVAKILIDLSALLLEHFASFLRFHPNPKNIFRVFVERLLEQLFDLFVLLQLRTKDNDCEKQFASMLKVVEDIMLNGLFHHIHISGFLSSTSSTVSQEGGSRVANESYHRHLFRKLEKIIKEKKVTAFGGLACLLRLFTNKAKVQQGTSLSFRGHQAFKKGSRVSGDAQEESMPLFEVFMNFIKPLLQECKHSSEKELSRTTVASEHSLIELHCMLRSVNDILGTFIQEKIYARTEDTLEGKHFSFLKEIYDAIYSISINLHFFWSSECLMGNVVEKMLPLIVREIVVGVGYFLEVEYKVFGDDLVIIWKMLLSFMTANLCITNSNPCSLLMNEILKFGCKLINVYSELRQVNYPLFALCKAVRLLINYSDSITDEYKAFSFSFHSYQLCLEAAKALVCSQEVLLTITKAVKSLPEGQAFSCIQQLNVDIDDALEWIRQSSTSVDRKSLDEDKVANAYTLDINIQAEVLGGVLAELYATVLESLSVTATNSILIGNSIKSLIKTLKPSLSSFLQIQSNHVNNFVFSVTGRSLSNPGFTELGNCSEVKLQSICWLFLFFFRVYVSSRSLYRQSISLMPPDLSHKASESFGDLFTSSHFMYWAKTPKKMDEGYFSWIVKPSISLPDAIDILSKGLFSNSFATPAPLVYILLVMAVQRLSDLTRLIKAFEYFHEKDALVNQMQLQNNFTAPKSLKKWKLLIAGLRKEALELTNFMTGHLSLLDSKRSLGKFEDGDKTSLACEGEWDCGFCSLDEKSLHVAVWWLFCQSTDVWCIHSTKKHLNKFFSYLFLFSVPCLVIGKDIMVGKMKGSFCHTVTLHRISVEFLQDTISFEQMIQCTNIASRFCHILKKLLSPILIHTTESNFDLDSSPNWLELLRILEKVPIMFNAHDGLNLQDDSSLSGSVSVLPSMISLECSKSLSSFPFSLELKACENFLNVFCEMPRFYGNTKSFSRYAAYMLNIERLLFSILLNLQDESFLNAPFELLRLFVTCRRAMKCLVMGSSEKLGVREFSYISTFFDCSSSVLWLFKSVYKIAGLPNAFFEKDSGLVQDMIYSLIDHTFYVLLKISEAKANATFIFLLKDMFKKYQLSETHDSLNENDNSPRISKLCNDWEHLDLIAEALKEHAEKFIVTFKSCVHSVKLDNISSSLEWNKFSSVISCFQALLLGLTLASDNMLKEMALENRKISILMQFFVSKLSSHITVFEDLVNFCLNMLILGGCRVAESVLNANYDLLTLSSVNETVKLSTPTDATTFSCSPAEHTVEIKSFQSVSGSTSGKEESGNSTFKKQRSSASHIRRAIDFFHIVNEIDLLKLKDSCGSLLQCLLKDTSPQIAFILRQLFCTSATILRIKCMPSYSRFFKYHPHSVKPVLNSIDIVFGTTCIILQEFSEMTGNPCWFSFALLDGVLTFLDVVGSLFSFVDPDISKDVYTQLIDLHLKALGRCINLEGKTATSSPHDSDKKMLVEQDETNWNSFLSLEHGNFCLDTFKTKLRMSIKKYIMIPSVVYLEIAIQMIERKFVGVQHEHKTIYQLSTGLDGGIVSSTSAASIEFLELILECFSGNSQFLKESMPSLVGAIINIVLHLQNPSIFYEEKKYQDKSKVDAGAAILMCVEVLTKVVGRRSFPMDSCHVSQCFHMPTVFFVGFHKLRASCFDWNSSIFSCNDGKYYLAGRQLNFVDRHLFVELYTSCCRLMCSTLKNQKRQAERCIHLLEESINTLLSCLEVVDSDTAKRGVFFSLKLQEAIKCASFFRRIYEEIRHQKDALGKYASLLLSNYISTFSGFGPTKAGIKREIDETLRPGVYSLIDICSRADLQQLHSLLSEGPCRSTLATLLHDYQHNFQYEGKI